MLQLYPAKSLEPQLIKLVGCLIAIPISGALVIAFLGMIFGLSQVLPVQAMPVSLIFFCLAIVVAGLFVIRGIRRFLSAKWRTVALMNLEEPVVLLSTDSVHVGDAFSVIYHQQIRQPVRVKQLTIRLIQRTHAVSRRDAYDFNDVKEYKRVRIVQVAQRKGQQYKAQTIFHREVNFTIPANEKPTSRNAEKQEEWLIRIHVAFSHRVSFQEEYTFCVSAAHNKV